MFTAEVKSNLGTVNVMTSSKGGLSSDQIAELCVARLLSVSETAHPAIQEQARVFRDQMLKIVAHYIKMGAQEDRATVCEKLNEAGFGDLAQQIRRL